MKTESAPAAAMAAPTNFKDRRFWLIMCGAVEVLLGLVAAAMIPLTAFTMFMSSRTGAGASLADLPQLISALLVYFGTAVFLFCMGIGAMLAKRWAHTLMLAVGWIWLVMGSLIAVASLGVLPAALDALAKSGTGTPLAHAVVFVFTIVLVTVFCIALPGAVVAIYQEKNVRATVRYWDPVPRWPDACPLPVLIAALMAALNVVSSLGALTDPTYPFFGMSLTGIPAALVNIIVALVAGWMGYALYRLSLAGWWTALALGLAEEVSAIITSIRQGHAALPAQDGLTPQQLEAMNNWTVMGLNGNLVVSIVASLLYLGFLVYLRRYFSRTNDMAHT